MKITDCYIFIIFMNYVQRFIIFHLIFFTFRCLHIGFPVTQWKRILLPTQETSVRSLGQEDPLEKGMATRSSILPGESHGQRSLGGYSP